MRPTSAVKLRGILRALAIDRVVLFAVLGNLVSLVFGPITILLVVLRFSSELQGFYYTFGSLTALQFLVEIGLSQVIIQFASHEWSALEMDVRGQVTGGEQALSRLRSLARLALTWYSVTALVVVSSLALIGTVLFSRGQSQHVNWFWPWITVCVGVGMNYSLGAVWALLQGCNQTAQFWFYRLVQQVLNGVVLWLAILAGAKLWTAGIATAAGLIWSFWFLWHYYPAFVSSVLKPPLAHRLEWRSQIWPVQWRVAISWFSAYFTTQFFTPLLFRLEGPVVAGQMGITSTLCLVLAALSSNWVVTKAPKFGVLISQHNYSALDNLFRKSFTVSLGVVLAGAGGMWGLTFLLYTFFGSLGHRLLPPLPTALLLVAVIFSSATTSLSTYLRAHKQEPLAGVYFGTSVLTGLLAVLLGVRFGATGVAAAYLAVVAIVQFPLSLFIFRRRRREWHHDIYSAGLLPGTAVPLSDRSI
ncbi:MAG: membrane protein [Herpetosiphon sp.]